ncbi:platelet glycoprotein VI [Echinops telfairi]|uniref:Platelet glycoprotein VI n=1 Tax=Echinops telfairi TaxID=9371 RepID=A0AC55D9A3_ECHTE|nr:platelet glycoprotein VI [Echinops telfairi]
MTLAPLEKPSLRAYPSALVPLRKSVKLLCQGPLHVDLYRLEKLKPREYQDRDTLFISVMEERFAGQYRCSYQNGSLWSPPSDLLDLVAVGVFSPPTLSAWPSTAVSPGQDVTLQCKTNFGFDQFALYKEGDMGPSKSLETWHPANFPIVTVTPGNSGIYRCYSFSSSAPYLWSHPSDPLKLVVTDFAHQDYTKVNVVRICLGAAVLLLLAGILAEDWRSQKKLLVRRGRAIHRPLPPLP